MQPENTSRYYTCLSLAWGRGVGHWRVEGLEDGGFEVDCMESNLRRLSFCRKDNLFRGNRTVR